MRISLLVTALVAASIVHAEPASPSPTPDMKGQFNATLGKIVDEAVTQIQLREQAKIAEGVRPVPHLVVPGPAGRTALAYGRETPDGMTFPILILIPGEPAASNSPSVKVEATYEVFKAHAITRMEWSADGFYLAVLSQQSSLAGPGGELAVLMPGSGRGKQIDRDVVSFSMSKDGRWLVYEKAKTKDDMTGPRLLMLSDGATGKQHLLTELAYPKEQIARLDAPDSETGKAKLSLRDYSGGLTNPKDSEAVIDLVEARLSK
jgi:hypothetical protein